MRKTSQHKIIRTYYTCIAMELTDDGTLKMSYSKTISKVKYFLIHTQTLYAHSLSGKSYVPSPTVLLYDS